MSAEMEQQIEQIIREWVWTRRWDGKSELVGADQAAKRIALLSAPQDRDVGARNAIDVAVGGWIIRQKEKGREQVNMDEISDVRRVADEAIILSTPPSVAVPEGWQLVPKEPTREMTMAACDRLPSCEHVFGHAGKLCANVYVAMLSASPSPVVDAPAQSVEREKALIHFLNTANDLNDKMSDAIGEATSIISGYPASTPTPVPADELRKALEAIKIMARNCEESAPEASQAYEHAAQIVAAALQQPALDAGKK